MKTILIVMVLITGITGTAIAQTNAEKIFDLSDDYAKRKFLIDIGRGNKLQLEFADITDINHVVNIDSLLRLFKKDISIFRDSLANELTSKRIDYIIDSSMARKIRIRQSMPAGNNFAVTKGEAAALKLDQDTVNFKGMVRTGTAKKGFGTRYYRVSFFLNDISELDSYIDSGLSEKIIRLRDNLSSPWLGDGYNRVVLKADRSVSSNHAKGYVAGGDYFNIRGTVDIQNYKNYFVPSFSVGAGLVLTNKGYFKRDIMVSWDPHFLFVKNDQGKLKTYRNDFLTLTWGQGFIKDNDPRKESHLLFVASFSYLVHRSGEVYEKNSMRLGAGRLSLFNGKTKIEPALYFNNFFKGVTPSLRFIQSF